MTRVSQINYIKFVEKTLEFFKIFENLLIILLLKINVLNKVKFECFL